MNHAPMLTVDEALAQMLDAARPLTHTETVTTLEASGRVLAEDQFSKIDVPGFDNSAMDGYALHIADFAALPDRFPVVQRIAAGSVGEPLAAGCAARIFTGAPVPPGCNAVVMQEDCQQDGDALLVKAKVLAGQHIRRRGEDIGSGHCILRAGTRLQPQHTALAASVGLAVLPVRKVLKVGVFFTGDELIMPGNPLPPGAIYNSNRFAIIGLLKALGCEVTDYGNVPDNLPRTMETLALAAVSNHVVVTCGGVSVGEEDHVKAAVQRLGQLNLWKIAMKPGKPLAVGNVQGAVFIGLPGNPVSAFVTFCLLARPLLLRSMGAEGVTPARMALPAAFNWPKADRRREFLRARLNSVGQVELYPQQGSGVMTSLVWADGLVDLPANTTVAEGDIVQFLPLSALLY